MIAIAAGPVLALTANESVVGMQNALGLIGASLIVLGVGAYVLLQAPIWWDKWSQYRLTQTRRKKIMGDRELKLRRTVQDIIFDGLLQKCVENDISNQENDMLLRWVGEQLDLPELIPTKDRSEAVKKQIIANRSRMAKVKPNLPDGKNGKFGPKAS